MCESSLYLRLKDAVPTPDLIWQWFAGRRRTNARSWGRRPRVMRGGGGLIWFVSSARSRRAMLKIGRDGKRMPAAEVVARIKALLASDGYGMRRVLATMVDCG